MSKSAGHTERVNDDWQQVLAQSMQGTDRLTSIIFLVLNVGIMSVSVRVGLASVWVLVLNFVTVWNLAVRVVTCVWMTVLGSSVSVSVLVKMLPDCVSVTVARFASFALRDGASGTFGTKQQSAG